MVGPVYIIAASLGVAFLLGLIKRVNIKIPWIIMLLTLAFMGFVSAQWLWALFFDGQQAHYVFTAGFKPPFSINLLMGRYEAVLTGLINLLGFAGGVYLWEKFKKQGINTIIIFLVFIMGLNVVIMTRDLFNLFVFLEIVSIATAGLILLDKDKSIKGLTAGFKYMIATGIIAGLLLLGTIFAYKFAGSLNIDDIANAGLPAVKGGIVAAFLIIIAVIFELKPFPANGWALDVYEGAPSGIAAMISSGVATAGLFILYKTINIGGGDWYYYVAMIGAITFLGSNLVGLNQNNAKRLLGYSSVGQVGLLTMVIGFSHILGEEFEFVAFTILISHFLAKAGLFWISGMMEKNDIKSWAVLHREPILVFLMGIFILALLGLPPFPSFFGKWELVMSLASEGKFVWILAILAGSLLEAIYLFRWFGYVFNNDERKMVIHNHIFVTAKKLAPVIIFGLALLGISYYAIQWLEVEIIRWYIPFVIVAALFFLDYFPTVIKNIIAIAGLGFYAYDLIYMDLMQSGDILRLVFASIFIVGGFVLLIPGFNHKGKRMGLYPLFFLMFTGLAGLIESKNTLQFFFSWEIMTIASYLLIIRGRKAMKPAFKYIVFSVGGAYFMLMAFAMAFKTNGGLTLDVLATFSEWSVWIAILLAIGLMVKIASLGLHIWLPGSYAEAENDVTPIISSILIKSGVFGLLIFFASSTVISQMPVNIPYILGWIGAITAIIGNMIAIFQEDAKKLIAYSSIGVMGYILFSVSMMSHLGWLTAVTYAIVHFLYKALLFVAIAGVIYRTRTRNLYEMGGLIKKMPISFIAVLIGIITLAGMPPLAGFAGKWLLYNAVIIKGWYIQGAMVFFAGIIAFLYCFKLIHNVFLGPIKDEHRKIRETTIWWIIPQAILIMAIMVISVYPRIILEPIGEYLTQMIPGEILQWDGTKAYTSIGYWDATKIMYIVMGMFAVLLGFLMFLSRKPQKIGQFDMVFQAERPSRPETTHVAYNMYAHYNKALGFLVAPRVTKFWKMVSEYLYSTGNHIRKIYSGNGQAYALHLMLYFVIAFFLITGGF